MSEAPPRGWRRLAGESRTLLTAILALVAGVVSLLFQLWPSWKPDPRERVGADLEVFAVEPEVKRIDWLREAYSKDLAAQTKRVFGELEPSRTERELKGTVVYVRAGVDGYKHRAIAIRARLYDADTQLRAPTPFSPAYAETSSVAIDSPNRRSVQLLFVPDLTDEPPAFVRVELIDSKSGAILAIDDSPRLVKGRISR